MGLSEPQNLILSFCLLCPCTCSAFKLFTSFPAINMFYPENVICLLYPLLIFKCTPGPEVIKLFSCSTKLSAKFQLLINTKILTNEKVLHVVFIMLIDVTMPKCWHFNIYEQDIFHAQLS